MSSIKLNESLKLHDIFKIGGKPIESPLTAAVYSYWKPSNKTSVPSGEWSATIIDGNTGEVEYNIGAGVLDEVSKSERPWKTQLKGTVDGSTHSADAFGFQVVGPGKL